MELDNLRIDVEKEREGAWVNVDDSTKFLVGSTRGAEYRRAVREETVKYVDDLQDMKNNEALINEITTRCMAKYILLGWEGLTEGGKELEYSEQKAFEILSDPAYRQIREYISQKADDLSLFQDTSRIKVAEEVKK